MSELAEKIKTLKAAHNVEATPQRIRQKQLTAEEPVTARIRKRAEGSAANQVIPSDDASRPNSAPQANSTEDSSTNPSVRFQERIDQDRQRKDDGPTPP